MNKIIAFLSLLPLLASAQNNSGEIHGDFELTLQSYNEDATIGAQEVDEKILNNSYLNIIYNKGNFTTGIRYESYLNALQDFDRDYKGNGIPYRFATYSLDGLEVTAGNYYEQFGSGLAFRSYEEKGLGIDNAMDGVRLKYAPIDGVYLKSFIGKSRTYFTYSEGIIRGLDGELNIKEAFAPKLSSQIILGGSIVSRYQKDNNPKFNLPQNVATYATRLNIIKGGLNYYGEYAYKINDPEGSLSFESNNYAPGSALMSNLTYSKKGLGVSIEAHRIDHFEFRSERQQSKEYIINYIPTLSKQHAYTLVALYPFATQAAGEFGYQFDLFYKIKRKSLLGGKYGTKIDVNFSRINSLNGGNSVLNDSTSHTPMFISITDETLFFSDFNIEINKKVNRKLKVIALLAFQSYNKDVIEGKTIGEYGNVTSKIGVLDISYKIKKGHTLRIELQELLSKKEDANAKDAEGDWSMALAEYTISPHWFFTVQDMYNWGNHDTSKQLHYMNINFGFMKGANRFVVGYGKKRAGIFCVGGVCKEVPSSNGFTLNISSSF